MRNIHLFLLCTAIGMLAAHCAAGKFADDPKFGGTHTKAGRDAITTDSKTSIILAVGLVAALGWTLRERRTRVHAEKGICRIASCIEAERCDHSTGEANRIVQRIKERAVRAMNGRRYDPIEQIINRNVKKATNGAKQ